LRVFRNSCSCLGSSSEIHGQHQPRRHGRYALADRHEIRVCSTTSSARASSEGGTASQAFCGLRMITSSTWSAVRSGGLPAALPWEFGRLVLPLGKSVPVCTWLCPISTFQDLGCVRCFLDEQHDASSGQMSRMEYSVRTRRPVGRRIGLPLWSLHKIPPEGETQNGLFVVRRGCIPLHPAA
jgi:hypothetical protein